MVYNWLQNAQDWFYPPTCLLCNAPGAAGLDLCAGCHKELPWNTRSCKHCALPLPAGDTDICARCLQRPPPFDNAFAPLIYAAPLDFLLGGFKFRAQLGTGRVLGTLLAQALAATGRGAPDLLLPVPLHRKRLLKRGFNQALELARPAGKHLNVTPGVNIAHRTRNTSQQSQLGADGRRANLRGAFRITGDVQGQDIAIVDDVITTGQTVGELAAALKRAGAARVRVWALCRAVQS
jgi:ComF family protein